MHIKLKKGQKRNYFIRSFRASRAIAFDTTALTGYDKNKADFAKGSLVDLAKLDPNLHLTVTGKMTGWVGQCQ